MDISNVITNVENWLSNAFSKVVSWILGAEKTLQPDIIIAENILNGLKTFNASAEGQTVESIIEAVIPASTGLIYAFFNQLPLWLADLQLIEADLTTPLTKQWAAAQTKLATMSDDVYACEMNSLKALFTKFFATNNGAAVNIQQALTLGQATHNLALVLNEPIGQ